MIVSALKVGDFAIISPDAYDEVVCSQANKKKTNSQNLNVKKTTRVFLGKIENFLVFFCLSFCMLL
jgi:hypothetical protein